MRAYVAAVLVVAACGGPGGSATPDGSTGGSDGAGSGSSGWTTLVARGWALNAGQDAYRCTRIQVPSDMWISGFHLLAPTGTHHAVLTIWPDGTQQGDYACDESTGTLTGQMLFASAVGNDDLELPAGVAIKLPAGSWINLNLHLFNATDQTVTCTQTNMPSTSCESGVQVKTIDSAAVVHEADMIFAGTTQLSIANDPAPHQPQSFTGGCVAPDDWHVVALWPHMHSLGTHSRFVAGPTTMLDTPFAFAEQKNYPMAEQLISKGMQVQVTCTYVNTTGAVVTYGPNSANEMCYTGVYKYPTGGIPTGCVTH